MFHASLGVVRANLLSLVHRLACSASAPGTDGVAIFGFKATMKSAESVLHWRWTSLPPSPAYLKYLEKREKAPPGVGDLWAGPSCCQAMSEGTGKNLPSR